MILQLLMAWLATRINRHQDQVIRYLREENRILKAKLQGRRIPLTDVERRRLAVLAHPIERKQLTDLSTIATPDTLRRWHRRLVAQAPSLAPPGTRIGRPRVQAEIEQLVIRMATENPRWGSRRIQGALSNLGYHIHNTTVRNILRRNHIDPAPIRGRVGMSWSQFVTLHWEVLVASGFFEALKSAITKTWPIAFKPVPILGARLKRLACMIQHRVLSILVCRANQCHIGTSFLEACTPPRTVSLQRVAQPLQPISMVHERSPPGARPVSATRVDHDLNRGRDAPIPRLLVVSTVQRFAYNGDQSLSQSQSRGSCKDSYPAAA